MAKKLFKKKSFWAKLPARSKVGIIVLGLMLFGAAAAFALSQQDASLQSKASLSCETGCMTTCSQISDAKQKATCVSGCTQKCQGQISNLPAICKQVDKYVALMERRGGLTGYQLSVAKRILVNKGEDIARDKSLSSADFTNWYKDRCTPTGTACDYDWSRVVPGNNRQDRLTPQERRTPMAEFYWPDSCKGYAKEGMACATVMTALTADEVLAYKNWLAAGKPTVTTICKAETSGQKPPQAPPSPSPISLPIPSVRPSPSPIVRPLPQPTGNCYYQKVVCFKEPCEAVLVCSNPEDPRTYPITPPQPVETQ